MLEGQCDPYWNSKSERRHNEVEISRTQVEVKPCQERHNKYQHAKIKF